MVPEHRQTQRQPEDERCCPNGRDEERHETKPCEPWTEGRDHDFPFVQGEQIGGLDLRGEKRSISNRRVQIGFQTSCIVASEKEVRSVEGGHGRSQEGYDWNQQEGLLNLPPPQDKERQRGDGREADIRKEALVVVAGHAPHSTKLGSLETKSVIHGPQSRKTASSMREIGIEYQSTRPTADGRP